MKVLVDRKKIVLNAIIKEYIKTVKPIGSKHLLSAYGFKYSAATLRSIMASLERDGYLTHPHTSAGRVPTVMGYRSYVNSVAGQNSLGLDQRRNIMDFFSSQLQLEELLRQTCKFLARITPYLGIIVRYTYKKMTLKHIDIVSLSNRQLLLVIITRTGEVFKDKIPVSKHDFDMQKIENILNKELGGLDLAQIKQKLETLKALGLFGTIFEEITESLIYLFEKQQSALYYDGVKNLLSLPEFAKTDLFSNILGVLEEGHSAINRLTSNNESTYIAIGDELMDFSASQVGLVFSPYHINKQIAGSVGIIGPMRMDYQTVIATTECVAGNLSMALQKMA